MLSHIKMEEADVIVIGGGLGGCMASMSAAKMGFTVILTEETDWLGGQLTSQAVPPDEHPWIEEFGCTATYREFRNRVREYYKKNYPLTEQALNDPILNPGNGWVSRLSHEPKVAMRVINDMLAPYVNSGKIKVFLEYRPIKASTYENIVKSVTIKHTSLPNQIILKGKYFIDATELGDVLPLAGVEYVVGAESKAATKEPHALDVKNPFDMQPITYVFAVDYIEGANFTIEKPNQYDFWKNFVPKFSNQPLLSWYTPSVKDPSTLKEFTLLPNNQGIPSLFTYRRILDINNLIGNLYEGDISLINWPQNDYFLGPIIDVSVEEKNKHLYGAKQLSLSLLYWLQTEAPRLDGGKGYPGLRLRKDVLGTEDGLAKFPYIRESRRIRSLYTVTENDVSKEVRGDRGIKIYTDSVGIGSYHIDIHHTTVSNRFTYIATYPYEIPLGALLPIRIKNLLPGGKNIGTTQVANGCYRLHPTEWNIGESVGYLVSFAILNNITPHEVRNNQKYLRDFQDLLQENGIQIHWPDRLDKLGGF